MDSVLRPSSLSKVHRMIMQRITTYDIPLGMIHKPDNSRQGWEGSIDKLRGLYLKKRAADLKTKFKNEILGVTLVRYGPS